MKTNEIIAGLRKLSTQGSEYRRTVCRLAADRLESLTVGADDHIGPNQRWIPVAERLPEVEYWSEDTTAGETVRFYRSRPMLVWSDNGVINATYHECRDVIDNQEQNADGCWLENQCGNNVKVTYWMPLPEPPKEG